MLEEALLLLFVLLFTTQTSLNNEALTVYQHRRVVNYNHHDEPAEVDVAGPKSDTQEAPTRQGFVGENESSPERVENPEAETTEDPSDDPIESKNKKSGPIVLRDTPPHLMFPRPQGRHESFDKKPFQKVERKNKYRSIPQYRDEAIYRRNQTYDVYSRPVSTFESRSTIDVLPPTVCYVCKVDLTNTRFLRQHEAHAHPWLVMCQACMYHFHDAREAQEHYATVHHTRNLKPARTQAILDTLNVSWSTCCSPTLEARGSLQEIPDIQQDFSCGRCSAIFHDRTELAKHEAHPLAHGESLEEVFPSLAESTLLLLSKRSKSPARKVSQSPVTNESSIVTSNPVDKESLEIYEQTSAAAVDDTLLPSVGVSTSANDMDIYSQAKYGITEYNDTFRNHSSPTQEPELINDTLSSNNQPAYFLYELTPREPEPEPDQFISRLLASQQSQSRQQPSQNDNHRRGGRGGKSKKKHQKSYKKQPFIPSPPRLEPIFDSGWTNVVGVPYHIRKSWDERKNREKQDREDRWVSDQILIPEGEDCGGW